MNITTGGKLAAITVAVLLTPWGAFGAAEETRQDGGLNLQFQLDLTELTLGELVRVDEAAQVSLREAGVDPAMDKWERLEQNYLAYPLANGEHVVLESILRFHTDRKDRETMRIGCPLGMLKQGGMHQVELRVSRRHAQLLVDGALVDEDWLVSPLREFRQAKGLSANVSKLVMRREPKEAAAFPAALPSALQYWTPAGHNTWVGDTMCLFHKGRFHVYYLLDRRHGSSKFGCGAAQVAHASSADLRTWQHHPLALPIDEWWLTYGTGLPVVRDGKVLLFYGMHTDRVVPRERTNMAEFPGNRRIMAAWLSGPDFNYAGYLVFRELVQREDGTLATRWPAEMIPPTDAAPGPAAALTLSPGAGAAFSEPIRIPSACRITLRLTPSSGAESYGLRIGDCELKFSPKRGRVQWAAAKGPEPSADLPSLEEIMAREPFTPIWRNPDPNIPCKGGDFTLQGFEHLDKPVKLDLIVLYEPKGRGAILDACINDQRTIITRRPGLKPAAFTFFTRGAPLKVEELLVRPIRQQGLTGTSNEFRS